MFLDLSLNPYFVEEKESVLKRRDEETESDRFRRFLVFFFLIGFNLV